MIKIEGQLDLSGEVHKELMRFLGKPTVRESLERCREEREKLRLQQEQSSGAVPSETDPAAE